MKRRLIFALFLMASLKSLIVYSETFEGEWTIDLRTKEQNKNSVDCGYASFSLHQVGNEIYGYHSFYTPGCGRLNESGPVEGISKGSTATLFVTSGRNGAVVKGIAKLKGDTLSWEILKEISPGSPEDDSPLILNKGLLKRQNIKPPN